MNHPRDSSASAARHTRQVIDHESYVTYYMEATQASGGQDGASKLHLLPQELACALLCRYSRGDSVEELRTYFLHFYLPTLEQAQRLHQQIGSDEALNMQFKGSASWMLLFALICFDESGSRITHQGEWFDPVDQPVLYAMVLKSLIPGHRYRDNYDARREAVVHEQRVVSALLQPRASWTAALDAFMRTWPALMQSHGYRDQVDDDKQPFNEFPLYIGVAVCAFDIDDAPFRDLPWYPRELVDHYRHHIRQTRDAWRTALIDPGAGLPDSARPKPKRISTRSKREAYVRWVEVVSGTAEQFESACNALGKRKTMPELFKMMEVLAGQHLAIQADIKDDETVEEQLHALCDARNLPPPVLPPTPPQGPARITALLAALHAHAAQHGLRMAVLDDEDDTWNVVLHGASAGDEFTELCEQLQIKQMLDSDWA